MSIYSPPPSCQIPVLAQIYEDTFGDIVLGRFVEVGGYDGETYSNTSFLADLGWRGVYVEPVFWKECAQRHARNHVQVFPLACGAESGELLLHVAGALTTGVTAALEAHLANPGSRRYMDAGEQREERVEMKTLDSLLARAEMPPGFDLLVVDVEGAEADVFAGFNLERWWPRMMIVEMHANNPEFVAFREDNLALEQRILAAGYRTIFEDQINTIYRRY